MMAAPLGVHRKSAYTIARAIYLVDGPRGFTRGLGPVLLRAFPVNASALFVYEGLMKVLYFIHPRVCVCVSENGFTYHCCCHRSS